MGFRELEQWIKRRARYDGEEGRRLEKERERDEKKEIGKR